MSDYRDSENYKSLGKARQTVVDLLMESITNPTPWMKGWQVSKPPMSLTGREYRGENNLMLTVTAMKRGYRDPRWMTFNQIKDNGWRFKTDESGTGLGKGAGVTVSFFEMRDRKTKSRFDKNTISNLSESEREEYLRKNVYPVRKSYTVFNADIVDGVPALAAAPQSEAESGNKYPEAAAFFRFWDENVCPVRYGGVDAAYSITKDRIRLPPKEEFVSEEEFYSTAFHELAHSVQHRLRPEERLSTDMSSPEYAADEVQAELCSVFLTQKFCGGMDMDAVRNSGSYMRMWIDRKDSLGSFFAALSEAEDMYKYACTTYEDYLGRGDEERTQTATGVGREDFAALEWRPGALGDAVPASFCEARMSKLPESDAGLVRDEINSDRDPVFRYLYFGGDAYGSDAKNAAALMTRCAAMGVDEDAAKRIFSASAWAGGVPEEVADAMAREAVAFTKKYRADLLAAKSEDGATEPKKKAGENPDEGK